MRSEKLANGSKFAYGHDGSDRVTSISQSTGEGEENSTQTHYTCGSVTELVSGNSVVNYEYDAKCRVTKVTLNGTAHVSAAYDDNATYNDILAEKNIPVTKTTLTNGKNETAEQSKDKHGRMRSFSCGGVNGIYYYDDRMRVTNKMLYGPHSHSWDDYDRLKGYSYRDYSESIQYDAYGKVSGVTMQDQYAAGGGFTRTYTYGYKGTAGRELESITTDGVTVKPQTDKLGRRAGREIENGNGKIAGEYMYYRKIGDHATNMPSSVYYGTKKNGKYVITDNVKYAYDKMGNIEKIYENGALKVRYVYDAMNRLIREDNKSFKKTWLYSYDNKGNILCKRTTDFTLKENVEENEYTSTGYTYEGDRLVGYGNETIGYDAMGNPTLYRGKSLEWNWRHLTKYNGMSLQYDNVYQRIKRGEEEYVYDSQDRIVKKSGAEFLYDDAGVSGIKYEGATYMYHRDGQGNIAALIDSSGNVVVKYEYDAWGNHEVYDGSGTKITQGTHVGRVNPYRYRGYYYDEELKLYYLKTRYYDPEVGRFINADDITYIDPETINGLNLYAYCGNNPVMRVDGNGTFFLSLLIGALIAGVISGTFSAVNTVRNGGGFLDGLGAFLGGFITGGVLGAAAILGGGLAVGAFAVTAGSIVGIALFLTVGTFAGGVLGYWLENKIQGNSISWADAILQGALTVMGGITNFIAGYALGYYGLWDSLKPGNRFGDVVRVVQDFFKMEVGSSGIRGLIGGIGLFLSNNALAMGIRAIIKYIATLPWKSAMPS